MREGTTILHVRLKLWLLALLGIWAVALDQPLLLMMLSVLALLALFVSGATSRQLAFACGGIGLALWGLAIMQGFFYVQAPRTVWLRLGAWNFYREGFWYGLTQGLRLTMTLAAGLALVYSTPADRIMHGLRSSGIPQGLCFLLMTALRFLPLIGRETRTAWLALRMRGFRLFRQSPVLSVQSCCGLLRPILAASVRRSEVLATSLVLRGFGGEIRIGPAIKDPLPVFQRILAVVALLATVVLLLLKLLQLLYLYELFYFPAFRPLYAFARAWL